MRVNAPLLLFLAIPIFCVIILLYFRFRSQFQRDKMTKLADELEMMFMPNESDPLFSSRGYIKGRYKDRLVKLQVSHLGWSVDHWGDKQQITKKGSFVMECKNVDQSKNKRTVPTGAFLDEIGKSVSNSNAFPNKSFEIIKFELYEQDLYFHFAIYDWNPEWQARDGKQVLEILRKTVSQIELDIDALQMKLI